MIGNILALVVGFIIGMVSTLGGESDVPTLNHIAFGGIVGFIAVLVVFGLTKLRILGDKVNVTMVGLGLGLVAAVIGGIVGRSIFF